MADSRTRVGRPTQAEAAELEARLRDAAIDVFLEHGFARTSMDAVARAAGITRPTLYARYPDKRTLFAAVVTWVLARQEWDAPMVEMERADLPAGLTTIARSMLARALDPDTVRLKLVVEHESAHFPKLALSTHQRTWSPYRRAVEELLTHHAEAGTVVVDDLESAAELFLAMVVALPARLAALGTARPAEVEERHLQHAVELFERGVMAR